MPWGAKVTWPRALRQVHERARSATLVPMAVDLVDVFSVARTVAHGGIPFGTPWWQAWSFEPELLLPVGILGYWYWRGLQQWSQRSRDHGPWRIASYYAGLLLVVLSDVSPLGGLGKHHFSFHMVQHELVMMVAIPLILLGAPTTPVLRGMPRWLREQTVEPALRAPGLRAIWGFLTHPIVAGVIFNAALFAWHLIPGWYAHALHNEVIHDLQHISFAFAALLVWWNIIDPKPLRARMSYPVRMAYLIVVGVPKHVLAAFLTLADTQFYREPYEIEGAYFQSLSIADDQVIGGMIMWVPSQILMVIVAGIIFFIWYQKQHAKDLAEQAAFEAQLHASRNEAARPAP